jgi:hypothetical protein
MYDVGTMRAAVHHGELLPDERYLVEATFRNRDSGVNILAATSTLAQGLNLPCDVVILAGTDRIDDTDPDERTRSSLMPHEILNALGRAGRAGYAATGLSVVVPGEPIGCDLARGLFSQNDDLPIIFSDGDQCVPLADPLTTLFDQIEVNGATGEEAEYLLRRLAVSLGTERVGVETFERLTRRSFGFYQRSYANQDVAEAWLAQRKATLTQALAAVVTSPTMPWQEELAAKTGASPGLISTLATAYDQAPLDSGDASDWLIWLLNQLDPAVDDFDVFLRPDTLKRVFGRAYGSQSSEEAMRRVGREGILTAVVIHRHRNCSFRIHRRQRRSGETADGARSKGQTGTPFRAASGTRPGLPLWCVDPGGPQDRSRWGAAGSSDGGVPASVGASWLSNAIPLRP